MNIPEMPKWFNEHGFKMTLGGEPILMVTRRNILISNRNVATFQMFPAFGEMVYHLVWNMVFSNNESASGQIILPEVQLKNAFFINGEETIKSAFALEHEAEVAFPGYYIRKGRFLNIPMPGTGMDRDPNISIFVREEIRAAVANFIKARRL